MVLPLTGFNVTICVKLYTSYLSMQHHAYVRIMSNNRKNKQTSCILMSIGYLTPLVSFKAIYNISHSLFSHLILFSTCKLFLKWGVLII